MVVRIRFGRGSTVAIGKRKNARIALLAASLMTLGAICLTLMGFWRLFRDLDLAGEFIFTSGILSHWQVWLFAAAGTQFGAWSLKDYYRGLAVEEMADEIESDNQASLSQAVAEEIPVSTRAALRP
jgi:hypothetical protein